MSGSFLGGESHAAFLQDIDGSFYGTTTVGGASDLGTVFKMTHDGVTTTFDTLIEFTGTSGSNKGSAPATALTLGADGNFYGTTSAGGASDLGTVFRITPDGTLTTLVNFSGNGGIDTNDSEITMLVGPNGPFESVLTPTDFTAADAGPPAIVIVARGDWMASLPSDPSAKWISTLCCNGFGDTGLYAIDFEITDAVIESAELDLFYAVDDTLGGGPGSNQGVYINGTAVSGNSTGGSFNSGEFNINRTDIAPLLVQGTNTLYINATDNGAPSGLIFSATINTTVATPVPAYEKVHSFTDAFNDVLNARILGSLPMAPLILGLNGDFFYGMTYQGGHPSDVTITPFGYGSIFRMTPDGVMTSLVEFTGEGINNGIRPIGSLVRGFDGNFYGTTGSDVTSGASSGNGTVFRMTPAGALTTLVNFTGSVWPKLWSRTSGGSITR